MRFGILSWWAGLPWQLRYGTALALLAASTLLFFVWRIFWPWGWAIGALLLLFAGRSDSEKNGYRF